MTTPLEMDRPVTALLARFALLAVFGFVFIPPLVHAAASARFSVDREASGDVAILIDGALFTRFVSSDQTTNKCYLWPLLGPHGTPLTRAYPMDDVEGEKKDHPHHRSLFFGFQEAGGFNTWHEKRTFTRSDGKPTSAKKVAHLGRQVCTKVQQATAAPDGSSASLVVEIENRAPDGTVYLKETRSHVFHLDPTSGSRIIDLEIVLTGTDSPRGGSSIIGKKDSGLSIRIAHSLTVDAKPGGRIINNVGDKDKKAWGKRAAWVDCNGPVGSKTFGIAMLNHPDSFRHPTPWHVRTYGLFTANPFALKEVAGEKDSGDIQLDAGESITLKHRIILHEGDEKTAQIAQAWERYVAEQPDTR